MLEGVILAGGRGERFWPLSRRRRPKQLLNLMGEQSLLRATWDRLGERLAPRAIRVVTSEQLVPAVRITLPELAGLQLIPEVVGKNTAPALAVAAALALRDGADPLQLVVPSDHWIPDATAFWTSVDHATRLAGAEDGPLMTFGIPITRPDTGYGYLERGAPRGEAEDAWQVARFHEKPDEETARAYMAAGDFYWNSGIFLWRAASFLAEVERTMPDLYGLVRPLVTAEEPLDLLPGIFRGAPAQSVDYGVLEHSQRVAMVAAGFAWSDIGTWERWADLAPADGAGNVLRGEVVSQQNEGCVLYAEEGLIAALGVKDLVVVRTEDVTLVLPKSRAPDVRRILRELEKRIGAANPYM